MIQPHGDGVPLSVPEQSDDWVHQIVHGTPVPTFVIDANHRVTHWNPACEAVTGCPASAVIGTDRSWAPFYAKQRPVMADLIVDGILAEQVDTYYGGKCRRSVTVPGAWEAEDFFAHFPGGGKWLSFTAAPLTDCDGTVVGAIETLRDITAEKRAAQALRESEHRLAAIVEGSPVPMFVIDEDHKVTHWNKACEAIIGLSKEQMVGTSDQWRPFYPEARPVMADLVVASDTESKVATHYDGKYKPSELIDGAWEAIDHFPYCRGGARWLYFTAAPLRGLDGRVVGAVETLQDISAQKNYERQLEHQATHDSLTGLANRFLFEDRLTQALAQSRRTETLIGLLFIDLDHFKVINDTLGHAAGDKVVQTTAQRIAKAVRAGDTVARLGGDEFAILLVAPESENVVADIIGRLIVDVSAPIEVDGQELVVGCSIGAALSPRDGTSGQDLLMHADAAMYRAKESGRSTFQFFTREMNDQACERMTVERDLRRALENDEFELFFQPQVNLFTDTIIGAEGLLRWHHPTLGMVSPDRFIPVAEETGLVLPLGRWVIDQACRLGRDWTADGRRLRISVNLSARQFHDPGLVRQVQAAMARWGTDSLAFDLELTESTVMKDTAAAAAILSRLKDQGVRLSMDDFGTGYSSLGQLRAFPFDMIKIDRSFIMDLHSGHGAEAVVRAIIGLAESLNLAVIAEGVETERQRDFLRAEGCIEAQGFLYSKAVPAAEFGRLLNRSP
ncbi:sensor domain-containing protein [Magnetospirillum moscoviense]|uniref:Diguanylate cyclase n=1 Tax=Magnetospirillum moscoviense TaxID=1437059 RepID=A0A178MXZ3_9PROT|nr:bifunctional diguanylate cyclase/phosphodiesterase [Magnetospirillum moscoviense]OAN60909.1 hypothetical protein A6A05_06785 [Magnetospirillum moscoviense]